jgi:hypothetical protein
MTIIFPYMKMSQYELKNEIEKLISIVTKILREPMILRNTWKLLLKECDEADSNRGDKSKRIEIKSLPMFADVLSSPLKR